MLSGVFLRPVKFNMGLFINEDKGNFHQGHPSDCDTVGNARCETIYCQGQRLVFKSQMNIGERKKGITRFSSSPPASLVKFS